MLWCNPNGKILKALEALASHEKTEYHKNAYTRMVSFLEFMSEKRQSIVTHVNTSHAVQIEKYREVLRSIIATVEVCNS